MASLSNSVLNDNVGYTYDGRGDIVLDHSSHSSDASLDHLP